MKAQLTVVTVSHDPDAVPVMNMDEAEAFLRAARAAMHKTLCYCPEHVFDRCLPRIIAWQINNEARIAIWIVREQTHNLERIIRDNVPIWTRSVFRYTLWEYRDNGKPAILAQREVTIRRLRHYWSMMQNPAQKYVLGDLFVRE